MNTDFTLPQLQSWLQQQMLLQVPPYPEADVAEVVNRSDRLSAAAHLDIYKGSYIARLRECMRAQFGALAHALGAGLFEAFTDHYLASYPSHSYTLNDLGKNFAGYLQQTRPDADSDTRETWPDFMIELAEFEYALSLIFDEFACEELEPAGADCPDEDLRLSPVFHLFRHSYPVCDYYLAYTRKENPELPLPGETCCVVVRRQYKMGLFVIKPLQFDFLELLKGGMAIGDALGETGRRRQLDASAMNGLWPVWRRFFIQSGFFGK